MNVFRKRTKPCIWAKNPLIPTIVLESTNIGWFLHLKPHNKPLISEAFCSFSFVMCILFCDTYVYLMENGDNNFYIQLQFECVSFLPTGC